MKIPKINTRIFTLLLILVPLFLSFIYVMTRSGPLASIPVTVIEVENQPLAPSLFGIGIVEARYSYNIGPTMTGHVLRLDADVGEHVVAGQVLGEIDPVDMKNKIVSKAAAMKRADASVIAAEAQVKESEARENYAKSQAKRYEQLVKAKTVSTEIAEAKAQEYQIARASLAATAANLNAVKEELAMLHADYDGLAQQLDDLRLTSPVDGLLVGRYVEPGSTVVAGQTVLEVIDPTSIWVNVRFDQLQSKGLSKDLIASIGLRSRAGESLSGKVARIEAMADAVTEEILAKVVFDKIPDSLPPIGELAEVTVSLPNLPDAPVVPNASIKRVNGQTGVWLVEDDTPRFVVVETGANDLDGHIQILDGLAIGDRIVVYSQKELVDHSRINIVEQIVESQS